ncbi:MAG: hypothetical protein LBP64_07965, partial [Tannerella sp.]|nr:hypothetical protein [Tannerella sp.]
MTVQRNSLTRQALQYMLPAFIMFATACGGGDSAYRDASRPVEQRVANLLKQMTLEEKVAQLDMLDASSILESSTAVSPEKMDRMMKNNTFGSVHDIYPVSATLSNDIQR